MITPPTTVLVVGATGSIGRLVVDEAIRQGYTTRAWVRDRNKARRLPADAEMIIGDVTRPETLPDAVAGIDALVFTLGSDGAGKVGAENVDYGGRRVSPPRIAAHRRRAERPVVHHRAPPSRRRRVAALSLAQPMQRSARPRRPHPPE